MGCFYIRLDRIHVAYIGPGQTICEVAQYTGRVKSLKQNFIEEKLKKLCFEDFDGYQATLANAFR